MLGNILKLSYTFFNFFFLTKVQSSLVGISLTWLSVSTTGYVYHRNSIMPHSWMCYTPSLDIFKVGWHLEQSSLLDGVPAHSRVVRSEWSLRSLPTHSLILWLSNHPFTVNNCKTGKGTSITTAQRSVSQQMNLANGISYIIHRRPTSFCYRSSWSSLLLFLILKATYSTIVVQENLERELSFRPW